MAGLTCHSRNLFDNLDPEYKYEYIYHWNRYSLILDHPGDNLDLTCKMENIIFPDNNENEGNSCLEHKDSSIDFGDILSLDNHCQLNIRIGMSHLGSKIDH